MLLLLLAACRPAPPSEKPCDEVIAYADADGDGFGDAPSARIACAGEGTGVADASDCDDGDAAVFPGATEVCNAVDDDCDGTVDGGAVDEGTWYADTDGDGYGDGAVTAEACDAPDGFVADATDCDDTAAAYHPTAPETDCADPNDYNCDGSVGYADADGDGRPACQECDDGDAAVFPGAVEVCNAVDDDCDGTVDVGAVDAGTWYADADGDGFGDGAVATAACEAPAGFVADASDCDDTDAAVSPDGVEVCNAADDDCDGTADEAAADVGTWYADADGDGFGDASATAAACEAPAGFVADASDCDDTDASANPDGIEVCDAADDDCDGAVDEGAADMGTWYADRDGDGFGDASVAAAGCDAPLGFVADVTDCDDTDAAVSPAGLEVCDAIDDDCDGTVDEPEAADAVAWYADGDGDGFGAAAMAETACEAPVGFVASADDCDDTDETAWPGAPEHCDGVDDDCDGATDEDGATFGTPWYVDADGDGHGVPGASVLACARPAGYAETAADCDDADATVHPGAPERCDAVDDDCDGAVDVAAVDMATWYADTDGDGFGAAGTAQDACEAPAGFVADATDCDDANAAVSPAATEVCNTVDDDCDATVDEPEATDAARWYADIDGDGYGNPASSQVACAAPASFVASADDCDDADATAWPGAPEHCDGVDDDCDGATDEDGATYGTPWYADVDGDGYGDASTSAVACEVPSGYSPDATDCEDSDGDVFPGALELCNAVDDDCDGDVDLGCTNGVSSGALTDAYLRAYGQGGDGAGGTVAGAGDVNGDGSPDLLVAAPDNDTTASTAGAAYVLLGTAGGDVSLARSDIILYGEAYFDYGAYSVAGGGDVDGDGYDDFLVGSFGSDRAVAGGGAAYLFRGSARPSVRGTFALADAIMVGGYMNYAVGSSVAIVGDVDGDGLDDMALGGFNAGAFIVRGPGASESLDSTDVMLSTGDWAAAVSTAGDFDGDGLADVAVGARGVDYSSSARDAGAVYVVPGSWTSSSVYLTATAGTTIVGYQPSQYIGEGGVAGGGDVNDDGYDDLIVGSDYGPGRIYVILGPGASRIDLSSDADGVITSSYDEFGYSVAIPGDLNGDGLDDIAVGARGVDTPASGAGAAYVFYGFTPGTLTASDADVALTGSSRSGSAGVSVAGVGDWDGDGLPDLAVGAPGEGTGGYAYVVTSSQ